MSDSRRFEIQNFRKGTTIGFVTLTDGVWDATTEVAGEILRSIQASQRTEEKVIEYLSSYTSQVLSYREVEAE